MEDCRAPGRQSDDQSAGLQGPAIATHERVHDRRIPGQFAQIDAQSVDRPLGWVRLHDEHLGLVEAPEGESISLGQRLCQGLVPAGPGVHMFEVLGVELVERSLP